MRTPKLDCTHECRELRASAPPSAGRRLASGLAFASLLLAPLATSADPTPELEPEIALEAQASATAEAPELEPEVAPEVIAPTAAAPPISIWEAQVQEQLQRDIEAREREAWGKSTPEEVAPAPRPRAAARRAAPASPVPTPRATARTLFSPIASDRERALARAAIDPAVELETASARDLASAIGALESARDAARTATLLTPEDGSAWLALARIELALASDGEGFEDARRALDRARALGQAPFDLDAALAPEVETPPIVARAPLRAPSAFDPLAARARALGERVRSLLVDAGARFRPQLDRIEDALGDRDPRLVAGYAALGAVLAWLLARALRRRGDLVVHIDYPSELRGTFRVRLDRKRRSWKRRAPEPDADILKGGVASARQHDFVARETPFRRLACRRYFVTIDGVLQDPATGEVVDHPFAQAAATVLHRRTVRCDLDATPGTAPVDLRIDWDGQPPRSAIVAARGVAAEPIEVDGGRARLRLPLGPHTLVIGSGDRVAERKVTVRSHRPTSVEVELGQQSAVVFKACPPAVEPYLAGRYEAAAQALTRDGQHASAHRLLARRSAELGRAGEAALHCEAAGDFLEAAELHAQLRNFAHAGELFGRANDPASAAEMFQLAGDPLRAGRAFEEARDYDRAIACYREAGDAPSWVEALERRGSIFEAACTAIDNGLATRGIRLLQRVAQGDPNYGDACLALADTFERERHFDLAARKLAEYVAASPVDAIEAATYSRLADLHEKAGDIEQALEVLETLRLVDPAHPNLATRAEELRKARSARRHLASSHIDGGMAPTVLLADQRYELMEEIGRGGMGVVWRARDRRLGRIVALKRLSENLRDHPRAVEAFLREARAAAALNHPNIVTVFDADQEDGRLFITMELLDGQPLHQLLRRRGRLTSNEIVAIGQQLCAGLQYAHDNGIVHRDVKTANVFVASDQRVKIMDFGLAKVAEEVRKTASLIGGTPYYMAPEQTLGGEVDGRADLYGLGVTLFELATGQVPFPDGDAYHHNRHTPAPDPRELAIDVDAGLAALVLELLAKDPGDRPASAAEVGRRLAALPLA